MDNKKKLLIGIGVLGIIITIISLILLVNDLPVNRLKKQLSLGQKYLSELQYEDAVLAFKSAIEIDSENEEAYVGLTKAYIGLEKYDEADKAVKSGIAAVGETTALLELQQQIISYYMTIGDQYVSEKKYFEAISSYEIALSLDLTDEEKYIKIANAYIEMAEYEKALETVSKGIVVLGETDALVQLREKIVKLLMPSVEESISQAQDIKEEIENKEEIETEDYSSEEADVNDETESEQEESSNSTEGKGGTIVLSNGTTVSPGGSLSLSDIQSASYVVGGTETVDFTVIASYGPYYANEDPEPNWAYDAKYAPGTAVPLAQYLYMFEQDPMYDYLAIELRGSQEWEYNFHIVR